MDGPAPSQRPGRAEIEAAARAMGVLPGDAAYPFVQGLCAFMDDLTTEHQTHEARIAGMLEQAKMAMALSDEAQKAAAEKLARRATAHLPGAINKLAYRQYWSNVMHGVGMLLAAAIVGGLIDRFLLS
jgi:hypothetical protein